MEIQTAKDAEITYLISPFKQESMLEKETDYFVYYRRCL